MLAIRDNGSGSCDFLFKCYIPKTWEGYLDECLPADILGIIFRSRQIRPPLLVVCEIRKARHHSLQGPNQVKRGGMQRSLKIELVEEEPSILTSGRCDNRGHLLAALGVQDSLVSPRSLQYKKCED